MKDALEMTICGIKCDNPKCDFNDMSVKVEDYLKWLNKPCPRCGENLLTQEDFDNTMMLLSFVSSMNEILPKREENAPIVTASIEMNGTGEMNFILKK